MRISLISLPTMKGLSLLKVKERFSSSGSKERPIYRYAYDERYGCPRRVLSGKLNQFDFIQQSKDSVDLKSMGEMLIETKANIIDHFVTKDGQIIDITGTPRNIHEASTMLNNLHDSFDKLPSDVKALFENDFDIFRASYKNGTLGTKIDGYYKSLEPSVSASTEKIEEKGEK